MGVPYRRLTARESRRGGGATAAVAAAAVAARAWLAAVRRAAARLYAAPAWQRRWATRRRLARARARAAGYEYDSASYARNFDDGVWKAEEGVFWRTRAAAGTAQPSSLFAACKHTPIVPCPVNC